MNANANTHETTPHPMPWAAWLALVLIWLLSLIPKLLGAHNMVWEIDIVPVVMRTTDWLAGGSFPAFGTLSSVAAYNWPMLVWLNAPAVILTNDPFWGMLLTGIIWNAISTFAVFRLSNDLFGLQVGLVAAALFTYHETAIAGTYTAWAQLLLPGFYALTLYALWRWHTTDRGAYLAMAGIVATAGFMTHFGAVLLYPAMFIIALVIGARWQWRWLLIGTLGVLVLIAPYLAFEAERDFADIRAFLSRDALVGQAALDAVAYLKPEGGPIAPPYDGPQPIEQPASDDAITAPSIATEQAPTPQPPTSPEVVTPAQPTPSRSIVERLVGFIVTIPEQFRYAFWLAFQGTPQGLGPFNDWGVIVRHVMSSLFIGGSLFAIVQVSLRLYRQGWRQFRQVITGTWAGHMLILLLFLLVIQAGFVVTRTPPWEQPTYYPGFVSVQMMMVAATLDACLRWLVPQQRLQRGLLMVAVTIMAAVGGLDRVGRVLNYDDSQHTPANAWLYRHIEAVADYIAQDWQGREPLTISYDIMPEMRNYWWIIPWNQVDPAYTMGLPYDYLLSLQGLTNANTNPIGWADDADYIVVWEPGLARHDLADYEVTRFGTVYVLKPR
ncbi:glycosyltransferase family 39 protein [Phototrophicus methaneseepsis]|uniref:Glycosyltransferase family 39 protein n=1 Tax=Phototrophicus methaneseepsis TaxID=2710758 RepID=A0A7S8E9X4_9CHLR|nr:glycosyltransferase family 39 protein [Phototrophicus methaneseepsis]QPC82954.1 glycosyltransferase family 39 protein [Phototrophicus methaneseepsis]